MEEITEDAHSINSGHQPSLQAFFSGAQRKPGPTWLPGSERREDKWWMDQYLHFSPQPQDTLIKT